MSSSEVGQKGQKAKEASRKLAVATTKTKNDALLAMANALNKNARVIIEANSIDLEAGEKKGLSRILLDRLALDGQRIQGMIEGLNIVRKYGKYPLLIQILQAQNIFRSRCKIEKIFKKWFQFAPDTQKSSKKSKKP